jgi:hypothetical protein
MITEPGQRYSLSRFRDHEGGTGETFSGVDYATGVDAAREFAAPARPG